MALIKVQKRAKPGPVFLLDEADYEHAKDFWIRDEDVVAVPVEAPVEPPVEPPAEVTDEPREPVPAPPELVVPPSAPPVYFRRRPGRPRKVVPPQG